MNPTRLLQALAFAATKHRDQRRKGADGSPYINHLIDVATILAAVGHVEDEPLLIAAVLHDTVEDTDTTFDDLEAQFGRDVVELVRELTDDKSLPKKVRKHHALVDYIEGGYTLDEFLGTHSRRRRSLLFGRRRSRWRAPDALYQCRPNLRGPLLLWPSRA